ncbi:MAG: HesA/MoeB/ThiF family protein [Clostridia bacterium]|nr:HesA/MoeB/ThiF family protein [Clostridia bacterium]
MNTERYSRNLILPGWGQETQERLADSTALVVGAGGLGSPVLYYLAAAGVGRIGIVEGDRVDQSNLQRQILYTTGDIGHPKGQAALERLGALNPEIDIRLYPYRLGFGNAAETIADYDIILDCTDNLATRRLLHHTCRKTGKPWVHGAISEYYGHVTTLLPDRGPCWSCLYEDGDSREPETTGTFGPVAGLIGTIQAGEAVKYLTGLGELLVGRLLIWDALSARFDEMTFPKRPTCPHC